MQMVLAFGHQRQHTRQSEYYHLPHAFTSQDYYELLLRRGDLTDREVAEITGVFPGLVSARRNDFINANPGKLICLKRKCRITGRNVSAWAVKSEV